jgi:primosomal protein N' (replication factor Y)
MIKSVMDFLDVLFPVSLGPLTYRCPNELSERAEPGMIVSAPLRNKVTKGIIKGRPVNALPGETKEILAIHGDTPVLGGKMLHLLKWMAEYYLSEEGLVLKNMLPREAFTKVKQKKTAIHLPSVPPLVSPPEAERGDREGLKGDYLSSFKNIDSGSECRILDSVKKDRHETFLLHAPSSSYEYSFLMQILSEIRDAILLAPEVLLADNLYPLLKERFGGRVCLFHSGMSGGKRSEAIDSILSGKSDIVLGTRSAIFTPMKKVSFISVLHEHSSSYKQEEGLRYHGRDVAVMRACLERATILLSSICPSFESLYNCRKGKYRLLESEAVAGKTRIRIIDMRYEKLLKPYLSKKVIDAAAKFMKRDGKVMFVINRRGYSTLLQCAECNHVEECPVCKIPLVFHKQDLLVKCHYCGYSTEVPERCGRCKGHSIELLGAGTQRVQEDIEKFLGIKTLRFDSDTSRKRSEVESLVGAAHSDDTRIVVGTKMMTRRLGTDGGFSMAAILNTDLSLQIPDFRSTEKTYQEIMSVGDRIMTSGEVFVQTRMPQHYLFKCIKNYDYRTFFREELERRKSLHYPPYSRLLLMRFISKKDLTDELSDIQKKSDKEVEILGPSLPEKKKGRYEFKLLLKSSVSGALHSAARTFLGAYAGSREVTIKIDVDPVLI